MSSLLPTVRGLIAYTIWADRTVLGELTSGRFSLSWGGCAPKT